MKRENGKDGGRGGNERKRPKVVRSSYIGWIKDWNRDGTTQIIISGDCEEIVIITQYENGIKNGVSYSFYRKTGRLLNATVFKKDKIIKQINMVSCPVENSILDNDDGSRWEGEICLSRSCGQGEEYDCENNLVYRGIEVNNHREGYGTSFFPDIHPPQVEYEGEWSSGLRQGYGSLYDRNGELIRSGLWFQDEPAQMSVTIASDKEPILFSTIIEELVIGSETCNSLEVINISHCEKLKRFIVNSGSCRCIKRLDISAMRALEEITINDNSFSGVSCSWKSQRCSEMFTKVSKKELSIQNNLKLRTVTIGCNCFSDFTRFVINSTVFIFNRLEIVHS